MCGSITCVQGMVLSFLSASLADIIAARRRARCAAARARSCRSWRPQIVEDQRRGYQCMRCSDFQHQAQCDFRIMAGHRCQPSNDRLRARRRVARVTQMMIERVFISALAFRTMQRHAMCYHTHRGLPHDGVCSCFGLRNLGRTHALSFFW